jgi:protein tyrosine phosphatase
MFTQIYFEIRGLTGILEIHDKYIDLEWQQRNRLAQGLQSPATEASSQWTRVSGDDVAKRNRYMNVDPFVNNRIRLKVPEGHSDYINASPIKLEQSIPDFDQAGDSKIALHTEKEAKHFIATQVCFSHVFGRWKYSQII